MDTTPRPYGFCLQNSFDQPTLERALLAGLERFDCVAVRHSTELLDFGQDETGVRARLKPASGETIEVRCDYLVGCDGGRSGVRQSLGIAMQGDRLPQEWLVIDTVDDYLTGEPECRFFCDPARPAMTLLRPGGERRWEWMLMEGETDQEMLADERIAELLAPHTRPGQVQVYRKCVYGFSAVVAECFSAGRVFLAGDAAHMTPPFAGQGLNAGLRDVRNLSWKLAAVLQGRFSPALLETYNEERHDAAREIVDMAVMLGDQIQPTDAKAAAERDAMFAELNKDPEQVAAFGRDIIAPLFDIRLKTGWFATDELAGRLLPQPVVKQNGAKVLLDDTLGAGFVALLGPGAELDDELLAHPLWRALSPVVHPMDEALAGFAGDMGGKVLLLRPDRFVLAAWRTSAGGGSKALDALEHYC
jgi:3-(3-hydroxy-phenyl)propionate hydroxylase